MITNLNCPRCHSDALYSYGRIKSGKQRYLCLVCSRQFVPDRSAQAMEKRPECPLCEGKMHIYMKDDKHIRFRCSRYPHCRGYRKVPR